MSLDAVLARLDIPLIAAPMFLVSNPALALACCSEGIMGSFPAHAARSREVFAQWLDEMDAGVRRLEDEGARPPAPWAVNLVLHATNRRMQGDLDLVVERKVPVVLTSKSAPGDAVKRIHDYGGVVIHDVANRRHAEKAAAAGVDGLIAVAGGAGGHCGTINPFSLVNEIRQVWDGPVALAGGMTTGGDVFAAQAMGADAAYLGTRFIATRESLASEGFKAMILETDATDVFYSEAMDGAPANWLAPSLRAAGLDLDVLRTTLPGEIVAGSANKTRWRDVYSAGHGVGNISDVPAAAALCRRLKAEYAEARAGFAARMGGGVAAATSIAAAR